MLKLTYDWPSGGEGTDAFDFSALPARSRGCNEGVGWYDAYFWSSTEGDSDNANVVLLYNNSSEAIRGNSEKCNGFSVRCVKDSN